MIPRSCSPSLGPQFVFEAQETSETDTLEVGGGGIELGWGFKGQHRCHPCKQQNGQCSLPLSSVTTSSESPQPLHSLMTEMSLRWLFSLQFSIFLTKKQKQKKNKKQNSILKSTSFIQKSYYFSHNNPLMKLCCIYFMEMTLFPHAVHFILEQSSSNISFYFYTFYILFLLYILSLMLCLKLWCQHLSSIT